MSRSHVVSMLVRSATALVACVSVSAVSLATAGSASATTYAARATLTPPIVTGPNLFGRSVAVSGDGTTAFVHQYPEGGGKGVGEGGTVFPFVNTGGNWSPQGGAIIDANGYANSGFGGSMALSQNGDTALIANGNVGPGALVYVRSGGVWTQQGPRIGCGNFDSISRVALSGDGNTALIGWCAFHRSGATWTQEPLPPPADGFGGTGFASSLALSSDGNRALIGGRGDNSSAGAVWGYQRVGGTWSQQGAKVTAPGIYRFGSDVTLSDDGTVGLASGEVDSATNGYVVLRWDGTGFAVSARLTPVGDWGYGLGGGALLGDGASAIVRGHRFIDVNGVWSDDGRVLPSIPGPDCDGCAHGTALSRDGSVFLVGTPTASDSAGHSRVGAATVFGLVPSHALTIQIAGSGSLAGEGFTCSASCVVHQPDQAPVTLTATSGAGTFGGWGGACSGFGPCQLAMTQDRLVSATFGFANQPAATSPPSVPSPLGGSTPSGISLPGKLRSLRVDPAGVVKVRVRCVDRVRCTGNATLRARLTADRKPATIARKRYSIAPREIRTVTFKLSARTRGILRRRRGELKATLRLTPAREGAKVLIKAVALTAGT